MWLQSWLRNRKDHTRRGAPRRFRLRFEALEPRAMLATLAVTTAADVVDSNDGLLSLREAVLQSNATAGSDAILLPAGTYDLTLAGAEEDGGLTGDLDLNGHLTIRGAGAGATILDGAGLDRVFDVHEDATVSLSNMTIQGGLASGVASGFPPRGGAIANAGILTIRDATLSGNSAEADGGAIFNADLASLTIHESTLSGNSAVGEAGAIFNQGAMSINNSVLSANHSDYLGGALVNRATGYFAPAGFREYDVSLNNCVLTGNSAYEGGAVWSGGKITLNSCGFLGNVATTRGGAVYLATSSASTTTIVNSTLTENIAESGGAIFVDNGSLTLRNSTVSGNTATVEAGGIFVGGQILMLYDCTVIGNTAPLGGDIISLNKGVFVYDSLIGDLYYA